MATQVRPAEQVEAQCRVAMAAMTKARGWDGQRVRADELALLDVLLDEWNEQVGKAKA